MYGRRLLLQGRLPLHGRIWTPTNMHWGNPHTRNQHHWPTVHQHHTQTLSNNNNNNNSHFTNIIPVNLVKNWRILLEHSFTVCMPLLMATIARSDYGENADEMASLIECKAKITEKPAPYHCEMQCQVKSGQVYFNVVVKRPNITP